MAWFDTSPEQILRSQRFRAIVAFVAVQLLVFSVLFLVNNRGTLWDSHPSNHDIKYLTDDDVNIYHKKEHYEFGFGGAELWTPPVEKVNKFLKYFNEVQESNVNGTSRKYIALHDAGGFGEKLYGMASAFLIAALTNRAFLVRIPYDIFDFPFYHWRYSGVVSDATGEGTYWALDTCFDTDSAQATTFRDQSLDQILRMPRVSIGTNCPLFVYITQNPLYIPKLEEWGMISANESVDWRTRGFQVMSYLMRYIFKPTDRLQQIARKFRNTWKEALVIGLQVRIGGQQSTFTDKASFLSTEDLSKFWRCASRIAESVQPRPKDIVWFLSTDSEEVVNMANEMYPQYISYLPGRITHLALSDLSDTPTGTYKITDLDKIVLDNLLLSYCDQLITTKTSTFGTTAAMRHGMIPLMVWNDMDECELIDTDKHFRW